MPTSRTVGATASMEHALFKTRLTRLLPGAERGLLEHQDCNEWLPNGGSAAEEEEEEEEDNGNHYHHHHHHKHHHRQQVV